MARWRLDDVQGGKQPVLIFQPSLWESSGRAFKVNWVEGSIRTRSQEPCQVRLLLTSHGRWRHVCYGLGWKKTIAGSIGSKCSVGIGDKNFSIRIESN